MNTLQRQKLIQINSDDRTSGSSSAQFSVNLGNDSKVNSVRAMAVKEIHFVNSFYNIEYYNNTFYYDTGAGEQSFVLPRGQYNLSTLISAITAKLATAMITATITLDALTQRLVWNVNVPMAFYQYRSNGEVNPLHDVLGIFGESSGLVTNYTSTGIPDLCGVKSVYIISPELASGSCITSQTKTKSVLAVVPVEAGFGEVVYSKNSDNESDVHVYDTALQNNLSSIRIEMQDEFGNLLVPNGHQIDMLLKIFY